MTIGFLASGDLEAMRADQAALMAHTVTVERGVESWDEDAQETTTVFETVYPEGPARVAVIHGTPTVTSSGESTTPQQVFVTIPYGVAPAPGDRVTITDPPPGVPVHVWVQSVEVPGVPTACRMSCGVLS